MNAFPAVFPLWISKEAPKHLGIQVALTIEVAIESAMRETCACHDCGKRGIFKAIPVE
jgi:hypothetical protein